MLICTESIHKSFSKLGIDCSNKIHCVMFHKRLVKYQRFFSVHK